jgi:hypothetical protein
MVAFVVVAIGLLQLSGCNAKGTVIGKVRFRGSPLPSGLIVFVDGGGIPHPGRIQRDGSYSVANLPCGPMKVAVATMFTGNIFLPEDGPRVPAVRIPRHYTHPDNSGLAKNVWRGVQVFMIDLNDDFDPEEVSLGIGQ